MELKALKKGDKLADWFYPRLTEVNRGNIIKQNIGNIYDGKGYIYIYIYIYYNSVSCH